MSSMDAEPTLKDTPAAAGELVLVVEDDDDVRTLVSNILDILNYRSIAAADATQAKEILRRQDIDILLTDIILPGGISGWQLAETALADDPGLRVLYMSGYPQKVGENDLSIPSGGNFLSKPFHADQVADALRQLAHD